MRRLWLAAPATVLLLGAAVAYFDDSDAPATSSGGSPTAEVTRRTLETTLKLSGHVESSDTRSLHWLQPAATATGSTGSTTTGMPTQPTASPSTRPPTQPSSPSPPGPYRPPTTEAPPTTVPPTTRTTTATTSSTTTTSTTTSTTTTTVVPSTASSAPPSTASQPLVVLPVAASQQPPGEGSQVPAESHTLTAQASAGQRLDRGDVAFAVDGRPTVVLFGGEAAYREQNDDVDDGPDVAQLEENLAALGYTDGGTLVVDEHFAAATADAVEAWQTAMGVEATGVVELGDVVFVPGAVTVVSTATTVGDAVQPGARLLDVTGGALLAVADVPVARSDEVAAGMPTRVTLADDSVVSGTVREVAGAATRAEGAEVTESVVQVTVQLDATESPGAVEQADVDVEVTLAASEDALVVPLGAIVDGGDGRPAVLLAGSPSQPVAIEAGLSADGYVEVVGGTLAEGDVVLLPAGA